jgi:hypothetical protein
MAAFLDMLRYEGSTVANWTRTENGYSVKLVGTKPPVVARWRSFGLSPTTRDGLALVTSLAGVDAATNL